MANSVTHAALPYPVKGCRFTIQIPYLDADGDPTDPTTPDTERSIDGAAYADCTEEVTTITGANGSGYITLTGDEVNASMVMVAAKVASGPKATLATLYPRVLPVVRSGTAQAGAAGSITLDSGASAIDDFYNGCIVRTTGGTGGGGGSGSLNNQARVITDYVGSTKVASISPSWETNPDATTTFEVLLTEMAYIRLADVGSIQANAITATAISADAITAAKIANGAIDAPTFAAGAIDAAAIATGAIDADAIAAAAITASKFAAGAIDAAAIGTGAIDADAIAADAITAAKIANGAIDAATFAAGAIDAAAIATGAIDADALAADAVDEILDDVVEGSLTMRQILRIALSVLGGKSTGGGTATHTFRDNADLKARVTATVDANGNRTAVTLDGT